MDSLVPLLALVACPLVMGAIMLWTMRRSRRSRRGPETQPVGEGAAETIAPSSVRYVRNARPVAVTVWAGGVRHQLSRRGAPGDVLALPSAAFHGPDLLGYLDLAWIEEVEEALALSRLRFAALPASRPTATPPRSDGRATSGEAP